MAESSSNPPININRNLVLVGRTGNGKSATANSIIRKKVFESRACAAGVTQDCQLETNEFENGQTINVIDTPGFFDFSSQSEFIGDEVIKCVDKVMDGIHAFLLVFSIRTRFSQEEEAVITNLRILFGEKVLRYMIVVFTGGDDLKESEITLEDYMGSGCPLPLKKIIRQTQNECVVFDNRTRDENEKNEQVQKLITTVDTLTLRNRGRPFMDDLIDLQARVIEVREKAAKDAEHAKQLEESMKKLMEEVESRLKAQIVMLETQLAQARIKTTEGLEETKDLKRMLAATEQRARELEVEKNGGSGDGGGGDGGGGGCSIL